MSTIYTSAEQLIGNTPLVELTHIEKEFDLKARLIAKLELFNPAGSVKDRVALAMINDAEMLMCHKVTHKNLIDSSPLFRYYLTHTPCNFFVKPIDSDTSEEI